MSDWDKYGADNNLETGAGYKKIFMHHTHFGKEAQMLNHFKEGEKYVTFDVAIEAIRAAEMALKEKYDIK